MENQKTISDEGLEAYKTAGKISVDVKKWSKNLIKPKSKVLDIAEKIEAKILENEGAGLAFPVNICINDITAHYTPRYNDETVICDSDVVTIDLGVHVDGYIADTAYTLDLSGKYSEMLKANQLALDRAIDLVKPGVSTTEIGEVIQNTLTESGYKPIENLTGHEVEQYDLHAGLSIPNIPIPYDQKIVLGMVLAIEPFTTDGYGRVIESQLAEIYSLIKKKAVRMRDARILLKKIENRKKLPFADRWFSKDINPMKLSLVLRELVSKGILKEHPVLHEKEKGIVSQFEHTMIVTEDGCEVITK